MLTHLQTMAVVRFSLSEPLSTSYRRVRSQLATHKPLTHSVPLPNARSSDSLLECTIHHYHKSMHALTAYGPGACSSIAKNIAHMWMWRQFARFCPSRPCIICKSAECAVWSGKWRIIWPSGNRAEKLVWQQSINALRICGDGAVFKWM